MLTVPAHCEHRIVPGVPSVVRCCRCGQMRGDGKLAPALPPWPIIRLGGGHIAEARHKPTGTMVRLRLCEQAS